MGELLSQQRPSAVLIATFALGALLLAAMGLFGVVSSIVTRRRHEMAVRLALGADHGRVLRQVVSEGALLVGIGVLVRTPGIYLAGRVIRGVLVGISPFDPLTLVAVWPPAWELVTMAACYVPARRVLGIEPVAVPSPGMTERRRCEEAIEQPSVPSAAERGRAPSAGVPTHARVRDEAGCTNTIAPAIARISAPVAPTAASFILIARRALGTAFAHVRGNRHRRDNEACTTSGSASVVSAIRSRAPRSL